MKRSDDRIRTTHVGSLIRTPELVELMIRDRPARTPSRSAFSSAGAQGPAY